MELSVDIKSVLVNNYLPYAKGTIVKRAIPSIDGMKPSQRRILYTMFNDGLLNGDKMKCATIVGRVLALHPHGDTAVYETMIRMTSGNEALTIPYIESKGNFGKHWSNMAYAAYRYTEAKLAPICMELFEGIKEDAVDLVDNFDSTKKEPVILPVKFPTILANNSEGIAVGKSSGIPSFDLKALCNATIGVIDGSITDIRKLANVIGAPEFPTGGYIRVNVNELYKLLETGRASFIIDSRVEVYSNKIIIREIPFNATIEDIVKDIKANMKTELKEVSDAKDLSGIKGLNATIQLKRGANPNKVLQKLYRLTDMRKSISFNTAVILNGKCDTYGILGLLREWVKFRIETIKRLYTHRLKVQKREEYRLEIWEKIDGHISEVVDILTKQSEVEAKESLVKRYGLSDEQADILLDVRLRSITTDRVRKELSKLEGVRKTIEDYEDFLQKEDRQKQQIIKELREIGDKYGKESRKCVMAKDITVEELREEEEEEDTSEVEVVITRSLKIKRLVSTQVRINFESEEHDPVVTRVLVRNNDKLLLFTKQGTCYKLKVSDIDSSRGYPKDNIYKLLSSVDDTSDIVYVCAANEYTGHFNVVFKNGSGRIVYLAQVSGNRFKYKNLFTEGNEEVAGITTADKFFMITRKKKAAYVDLTASAGLGGRKAFKIARIGEDDEIFGLQPYTRVPNFESIDLERYMKKYCVCIRDKLWA